MELAALRHRPGWFLGVHAFQRYLKLNFFYGQRLKPIPPGPSKDANARYLDLHEDDDLDEAQLTSWVKQTAACSGLRPVAKAFGAAVGLT